ncbi:hypothetical protein [Nocardia sp. CNY236]|uniref:hypothetical protein n=1 Tax=Nocardia sp. CNY236 TaxID=1169152 RepID=UPI0012DF65C5|nr:hypothetical protein [Nocardia sp. CNY236]
MVIEVDKGSEDDLDVLVNYVPHRFPPTGDRSLPGRTSRLHGQSRPRLSWVRGGRAMRW